MPIKKTVKTSILFGLAMTTSFSSSLVCLSGAQADSCSILTNKELIDMPIKKTVKTLHLLGLAISTSLVCLSPVQAETSPILGRQGLKIGSTTTNSNAAIGFGSVHVGSSATTKSYQVTNTAISGSSPINGSLIINNITDSRLSGLGLSAYSYGPLNAGQLTENLGITFTPVRAGALTNQFVNINDSTNNNTQKLAVTGAAYDYAKASSLPTTVNFGNVRIGTVPNQVLTLTNLAPTSAYSEKLDASVKSTTGSAKASGTVTLLAGGASSTKLSVGVNAGMAGSKIGTATFSMTSSGEGTSGLDSTRLSSQAVNVAANVFRLATGSTSPNPINFTNSHVGDVVSQALIVANTASSDGYSEKLNASFGANIGNVTNNNGAASLVKAGGTSNNLSVGLDTSSAGAKNGSATVNYYSDGTGTDNEIAIANGTSTVNVTGAIYDYAKASTLPATVDLGNVHVGAVTSQALTLFNRAPTSAYSEKLDAGVTSISGAATAAGVVNLLAGGSSSTNLSVGVNTGTAGNKTGSATFAMISDGTGTSALANTSLSSQTVNVSANVFRLAENVTKPNPINFSSSHVGDEVSQTLNITNKAINDGYSEKLDASFGVAGGDANHNNVGISQLAAGASNNDMVVSLDTQTAGAKAGTIIIDYQSNGVGTSGLGFSGLSSEILKVSGDVYNYANVLLGSSGYGSFSSGAVNQYILDFGDISQGSGLFTANLSVMNNGLNSEWTDLLDGQFNVNAVSAWTVFGENDQLEFANIFGGSSYNGFNFGLDTLALNIGQYAGDITLNLLGHNKSGYQGVLSSIYLHINANVFAQPIVPSFKDLQTTVPEPGILWLFGCAGLGLLGYRSRSIRWTNYLRTS